jgi:hypothetical protein
LQELPEHLRFRINSIINMRVSKRVKEHMDPYK